MTRPMVFLRTSLTSARPDASPWEVAMVYRDESSVRVADAYLHRDEVDLAVCDWPVLNRGEFLRRHPAYRRSQTPATGMPELYLRGNDLARLVRDWTEDAVVIGLRPTLDLTALTKLLRHNNIHHAWFEQPIDLAVLAAGWVTAMSQVHAWPLPPVQTAPNMSLLCGVTPPQDRHTALGGAMWTVQWWDQLHTWRPPVEMADPVADASPAMTVGPR